MFEGGFDDDIDLPNSPRYYSNHNQSIDEETIDFRHSMQVQSQLPDDMAPIHNPTGQSMFGASLNFINSIIGAGIIGIPYAFYQCGLWSGLISIVSVALLVSQSVTMLIECGIKAKKFDLEELSDHLLGTQGYYFALTSMFLFAYGAQIAYLVIVGDTVPVVIESLLGNTSSFDPTSTFHLRLRAGVMLALATFIILPLALQKELKAFFWTSFLSISSDVILVVIALLIAPHTARDQAIQRGETPFTLSQASFFNPTIFAGIGTMSFAFVCQHNSFIVFKTLKVQSLYTWRKVAYSSVSFAFFICVIFGLGGYLSFGPRVQGDFLNSFPLSSVPASVTRALLGGCMLLTWPLESFVSRHCLLTILSRYRTRQREREKNSTSPSSTRNIPMDLENKQRGERYEDDPSSVPNPILLTSPSLTHPPSSSSTFSSPFSPSSPLWRSFPPTPSSSSSSSHFTSLPRSEDDETEGEDEEEEEEYDDDDDDDDEEEDEEEEEDHENNSVRNNRQKEVEAGIGVGVGGGGGEYVSVSLADSLHCPPPLSSSSFPSSSLSLSLSALDDNDDSEIEGPSSSSSSSSSSLMTVGRFLSGLLSFRSSLLSSFPSSSSSSSSSMTTSHSSPFRPLSSSSSSSSSSDLRFLDSSHSPLSPPSTLTTSPSTSSLSPSPPSSPYLTSSSTSSSSFSPSSPRKRSNKIQSPSSSYSPLSHSSSHSHSPPSSPTSPSLISSSSSSSSLLSHLFSFNSSNNSESTPSKRQQHQHQQQLEQHSSSTNKKNNKKKKPFKKSHSKQKQQRTNNTLKNKPYTLHQKSSLNEKSASSPHPIDESTESSSTSSSSSSSFPLVTHKESVLVTLLLWSSALSLAISAQQLHVVLALTGAAAASLLGYIIPPLLYIQTYRLEYDALSQALYSPSARSSIQAVQTLFFPRLVSFLRRFGLCFFMLFFGGLAFVSGVGTVLIEASQNSE